MKNFIQHGDIVDLVAPTGGFTSGKIVRIGGLVGVPQCTVPAGAVGAVKLAGVFELPKVSAQAWAAGDRIYLLADGSAVTNVSATGVYPIGHATAIALNPSAVGRVRLNGTGTTAVA